MSYIEINIRPYCVGKRFIFLILTLACLSACKQEPQYELKEPFGKNTIAAADDLERESNIIKIPKKNFDRTKWEEKQRHNYAIKKIIKQAREWDPNEGKRRRY